MWELGAHAAQVYALWAFLLLLGCFGPHLLVLGLYLRGWRSRRSRWLLLTELVYGFVNPVLYLLVFQPALFRQWTPAWLPLVCWLGWAVYWAARFFGAATEGLGRTRPRRCARIVLLVTTVLITGLALRDLLAVVRGVVPIANDSWPAPWSFLEGAFCLPLYLLPMAAALRQLSTTRTDAAWVASSDFFVGQLPRWVAPTLVVVCGLAVGAALQPTRPDEVQALLLQNRDAIIAASRDRNLDPRLLASIIQVTQRDINRPFLSGVEDLVTSAWLLDAKSGLLLAEAIDPSLGITQVKANTVLTACAIRELSDPGDPGARGWLGKDYRSVRAISESALERVPGPSLRRARPPPGVRLPLKRHVVATLKTPEGNFAYSAFLLDLMACQWEGTHPNWSIRSRPEILATLFQLGFDHSFPKADPQANDFGRRVQQAFDDPWMRATFGSYPRNTEGPE